MDYAYIRIELIKFAILNRIKDLMILKINTEKLVDSPFDGTNEQNFNFDNDLVKDFVQDIKFGHPTCYLISGYRGAGKTSYIKKVESELRQHEEIVFVYTSFAKYKNHSYLLRKLIRGLYFAIEEKNDRKKNPNLPQSDSKINKSLRDDTKIKLGDLFERTFNDISNSKNVLIKTESIVEVELDVIKVCSWLLLIIGAFFFLIYPTNSVWQKVLPGATIAFSIYKSITTFLSIKKKNSVLTNEANEFNRKSLYDEEISDYHFINLLKNLSSQGFKIVFVLDELDKVEEAEVLSLIKEMKPFLVSGLANFIVIAGQDLFYRYKTSDQLDDSVLSTLFSRIIHVPLFTSSELSFVFYNLLTEEDRKLTYGNKSVQYFIDRLIFQSKRIPRKFINQVRQNVIRQDGVAFIEIDEKSEENKLYSDVMAIIQKIDDENISVKHSDGIRDYLVMQLFLKADRILSMSWSGCRFTKENL